MKQTFSNLIAESPNKVNGERLPSEEYNDKKDNLINLITDTGQTVDINNFNQFTKAVESLATNPYDIYCKTTDNPYNLTSYQPVTEYFAGMKLIFRWGTESTRKGLLGQQDQLNLNNLGYKNCIHYTHRLGYTPKYNIGNLVVAYYDPIHDLFIIRDDMASQQPPQNTYLNVLASQINWYPNDDNGYRVELRLPKEYDNSDPSNNIPITQSCLYAGQNIIQFIMALDNNNPNPTTVITPNSVVSIRVVNNDVNPFIGDYDLRLDTCTDITQPITLQNAQGQVSVYISIVFVPNTDPHAPPGKDFVGLLCDFKLLNFYLNDTSD